MPTSLVVRETQAKTELRYNLTSITMSTAQPRSKQTCTMITVGDNVRKLELLDVVGSNVK